MPFRVANFREFLKIIKKDSRCVFYGKVLCRCRMTLGNGENNVLKSIFLIIGSLIYQLYTVFVMCQ